MPVGIFVDAQGLVDVLRSVEREDAAQRQNASVSGVELFRAPHREIHVKLLRHTRLRPRRASEYVNLLKGESGRSIGPQQVEPVTAGWIVGAGGGRLVTAPVDEAQELTPELRACAGIRGVKDDLD
jgi:hypothetical protein